MKKYTHLIVNSSNIFHFLINGKKMQARWAVTFQAGTWISPARVHSALLQGGKAAWAGLHLPQEPCSKILDDENQVPDILNITWCLLPISEGSRYMICHIWTQKCNLELPVGWPAPAVRDVLKKTEMTAKYIIVPECVQKQELVRMIW